MDNQFISKLSLLIVAGLLTVAATPCLAESSAQQQPQIPIDRFARVEPGFYRGAEPYPYEESLKALKRLGVRTIIDLRTTEWDMEEESQIAKALGIRYIPMPIDSFSRPEDKNIDQILRYVADPALRPVYLHCRHGEDRTGLVVGLYRYYAQSWKPETAYAEMLDNGFHPILWGLRNYFFERTNWRPRGYVEGLDEPRQRRAAAETR